MKIYTLLHYDDPRAAHEWLAEAIGFEPVALREDDGKIAHAEMRWGEDLIMFNASSEEFPKTQVSVYLTCKDPDALYARTKAAGGEILRELVDQDYGSREFTVLDPEGHSWSFGTYEPR